MMVPQEFVGLIASQIVLSHLGKILWPRGGGPRVISEVQVAIIDRSDRKLGQVRNRAYKTLRYSKAARDRDAGKCGR